MTRSPAKATPGATIGPIQPRVREATPDDASDIVGVIKAAFAEYDGALDPPSSAHRETPETVRQTLATGHALMVWIDGEAVGCVLYEARGDYLYFGRLAVLPSSRGRGIARTLLDAVEERARHLGLKRVQLGIRIALPHLKDHYERHGYRVTEERHHEGYAEPTEYKMEKQL